MFDKRKAFGFLVLIFSLFFVLVVGQNEPQYVFAVGFLYAFFLIFHAKLERWAQKVKNPLRTYGLLVFLGGMIIEVAAYTQGIWRAAHGLNPYVFCPESFACDVFFFGVPYYALLSFGFIWLLRRYSFSVKSFGWSLWFFWALSVDQFSHTVDLLAGNIFSFIIAGSLLLFAFHGPYVIFQKRIAEAYPNRKTGKKKYFLLLLIQIATFPLTILLVGLKTLLFK